MTLTRSHVVCALAIFIATAGGRAWSQETGKTKDDALESLLKELNEPEKGATKSDKAARADGEKAGAAREKTAAGSATRKAEKAVERPGRKTARPENAAMRARSRPRIKHSTSCSGNWARPRTSRPPRINPRAEAPATIAGRRPGAVAANRLPISSGAKTKTSMNGSRN